MSTIRPYRRNAADAGEGSVAMSKDLVHSDGDKLGRGQFLVYEAEDGQLKIDVRLEDETVWLTQQLMAELFQSSKQTINHHIQSIYQEGELHPKTTVKKYLTVRREGNREVSRLLGYYNLDMIISVGYRVKSHVATRFRIWATQRLREYIVKGFVLDDERLKNPDQPFDYFDELIRRIQDNYLSQKNIFLQRIIREGRSKGIVVFFASQSPNDYQQKFFNFQELLESAFIFQCEGVAAGSVQDILGCSNKTAKDLQTEIARFEPWQVIARSPEKNEEFVKYTAEAFYKNY